MRAFSMLHSSYSSRPGLDSLPPRPIRLLFHPFLVHPPPPRPSRMVELSLPTLETPESALASLLPSLVFVDPVVLEQQDLYEPRQILSKLHSKTH